MKRVATIDRFKGAWRALKNLAPERLAALGKASTISIDLVCARGLGAVSDENAHHGHRFSPAKVTVLAAAGGSHHEGREALRVHEWRVVADGGVLAGMTRTVGLIVNPIAGMGGSVGLKGTDGAATLAEAWARGAVPHSSARARRAMAALAAALPGAAVVVAPDTMGAEAAAGLPLTVDVLDGTVSGETKPADTRRMAAALAARGVAAVLFAGGDGTARDVSGVLGLETAMLGIPCGVKMHSGVFATNPEAAGRLAADLLCMGSARVGLREVEITDVDEDAVRVGRNAARLYGYARAPYARGLLQGAKGGPPPSNAAMLDAACAEIARDLAPGVLYLVGPGTTAKRVLTALRLQGTLLGVDAVRDGVLVGRDVSEAEALALAGDGPIGLIVGVTGGQGFVFGRGNQQIGPEVIRRAGRDGLIIAASVDKLTALPEPRLLVDTGDPVIDAALAGYVRVRIGPRQSMLMRLAP